MLLLQYRSTTGLSSFHGQRVQTGLVVLPSSTLVMRKQKASDKRTSRRQRGILNDEEQARLGSATTATMTSSPMSKAEWKHKKNVRSSSVSALNNNNNNNIQPEKLGGRGRSRKRSNLYQSLSFYHDKFLALLTEEYKYEVSSNFEVDDTRYCSLLVYRHACCIYLLLVPPSYTFFLCTGRPSHWKDKSQYR